MPHWLVEIVGSAPKEELDELPNLVGGAFLSVEHDAGKPLLGSSQFDALTDQRDVHKMAGEMLQRLSQLLQLHVGMRGELKPGNVLQVDDQGGRRVRLLTNSFTLDVISSQGLKDLAARD